MKIFVFILLTSPYVARSLYLGGHVCQNIWDSAKNNLLLPGELAVNEGNYQKALFMLVKGGGSRGDQKLQSDVFTSFHDLLVDFQAPPLRFDQHHINAFITAVTQPGGPGEAAFNYLKTQANALPHGVTTTMPQFRHLLKQMWFSNSHGFKHVFIGNKFPASNEYNGFHNWYQFYTEEVRGKTGIICLPNVEANKRPYFLSDLLFTWRGAKKANPSSMFVGTSPAFDLALFTTCFLKGRGAGRWHFPMGRPISTYCQCDIDTPGIGTSRVEVTTVENSYGKVVTAYPTAVY